MTGDVTPRITHDGPAVVLQLVAEVVELQEASFQLQERPWLMKDSISAGFYNAISTQLVLLREGDQVVRRVERPSAAASVRPLARHPADRGGERFVELV